LRTDDGRHARRDTMAARARDLVVWLWTGRTRVETNGRHSPDNLPPTAPTALQLVRRQDNERAEAVAWTAVMARVEAAPKTARERFNRRVAQADRAADPVRRAARQVVTHAATVTGPVRHRISQQMTPAQQWARGRFDAALTAKRQRDATQYARLANGEPGLMARIRRA
jgi:hypothetical protein